MASSPAGRPEKKGLPQRPWREWSTPEFEVDADGPIAAGIDGEAMTLEPPLRFRIKPGVLRVRIAHAHPGASPSASIPEDLWGGVRALARVAAGHSPGDLDLIDYCEIVASSRRATTSSSTRA